MTSNEYILYIMLMGYNKIEIQQHGINTQEVLDKLQNLIQKTEKRNKMPKNLNPKTISELHKKVSEVDNEAFENGRFSSMVMVILILDYLLNELRVPEIRNKFGHFDTLQMIHELEVNKVLRPILMQHHRVFTKMINVLGY